jgi:hypothetical protein
MSLVKRSSGLSARLVYTARYRLDGKKPAIGTARKIVKLDAVILRAVSMGATEAEVLPTLKNISTFEDAHVSSKMLMLLKIRRT